MFLKPIIGHLNETKGTLLLPSLLISGLLRATVPLWQWGYSRSTIVLCHPTAPGSSLAFWIIPVPPTCELPLRQVMVLRWGGEIQLRRNSESPGPTGLTAADAHLRHATCFSPHTMCWRTHADYSDRNRGGSLHFRQRELGAVIG